MSDGLRYDRVGPWSVVQALGNALEMPEMPYGKKQTADSVQEWLRTLEYRLGVMWQRCKTQEELANGFQREP